MAARTVVKCRSMWNETAIRECMEGALKIRETRVRYGSKPFRGRQREVLDMPDSSRKPFVCSCGNHRTTAETVPFNSRQDMANQQFRGQIWTNQTPKAGFAVKSFRFRLYEFSQGLTKSHRSARKGTPEASNTGNFYSHSTVTR